MTRPAEAASPPSLTRVFCVDDNVELTAILRLMIGSDASMQWVGCLASADRLIEKLRALSPPADVVLMDASMPGKCPFSVMSELAAKLPAVKTIVYSGHHDAAIVDRAQRMSARGVVSKRDEPDAILFAIREVAAGRSCWPSPLPKPVRPGPAKLSR